MSEQKTYVTSRGVTIRILELSPLIIKRMERQYADQNPKPKPPTYVIETAGGGTETHVHDDTTVETAREKAALKNYRQALASWESGLETLTLRLMAVAGVDFDMPEGDAWEAAPKAMGFIIPTDPVERKLFYFETVAVGTSADMVAVMGLVMGLDEVQGGSDQETVMDMFHTAIQK